MEKSYEYVNHPNHYNEFSKETWEMMIDVWGLDNFLIFCEMNAFKYKMRAGSKLGETADKDVMKANWYLNKAAELKCK
jgi:hypothetical protein